MAASESSVNGDFMRVDMASTSSLSPSRVFSPTRLRMFQANSISLSRRNTHHLSSPRIRADKESNDDQTLVISLTLANEVIDLGDLSPILPLTVWDGKPVPSNIMIDGLSENHPKVIRVNAILRARKETGRYGVHFQPESQPRGPPNWQCLVNSLSPNSRSILHPSRPIDISYGAVSNDGQSRRTVVVGSSEADRIIDSGDLSPTLQYAGLAGSPLPSNIMIAGVDINDPRVIRINTLLQARQEMPAQPGVLNPNSVGKAFWREYYIHFKNNREMLRGLYAESSVFTFQGIDYVGAEAITYLLGCLPKEWDPSNVDIDCSQCGSSDHVNVQVTGAMHTNSDWQLSGPAVELLSPVMESTRSYFRFCQSFHLAKNLEEKYYVVNEIFRLIN